MFYQEYVNTNRFTEPLTISETSENKMEPNTVYYIPNRKGELTVKGTNGEYQSPETETVLYNPLKDAYFDGVEMVVYKVENLIKDQVVNKIQVEFSETNLDILSHNSIFINADAIKGYKTTNNEEGNNIYSFETIEDVSTKIRYLGVITSDLKTDEFIILNYYTTD